MNLNKAAIEINEERRNVGFDSYDITVRQIVDMVVEDTINVSPDYQRKFVWDSIRQSNLIESIFLGIPIPSLFMATNEDSTWEVIDGLQRITTLINFIYPEKYLNSEGFYKKLMLKGMEKIPSLNGAHFDDLNNNLKLKLLTRPIRVTVLNDKSDFQVRFDLFERLNTGGITLHEQEIRNCVFQGKFNYFLKECTNDPRLNQLIKRNDKSGRGNVEELVLKLFAYYEDRNNFKHSVKDFLNDYMAKKTETFNNKKELRRLYDSVLSVLCDALPNGIVRSNRPNSTPLVLFEAITVGVADILASGGVVNAEALLSALDDNDLRYLTTGATNSALKLNERISFVRQQVRL